MCIWCFPTKVNVVLFCFRVFMYFANLYAWYKHSLWLGYWYFNANRTALCVQLFFGFFCTCINMQIWSCSPAHAFRLSIVCWWSVSLAGLWRHTGGCVSSAETGDAGDAHRAQAFLAGGQSPDDPCLYAGRDGCKLCQLENDWVAPLLQVSPAWVCDYCLSDFLFLPRIQN